MTGNPSGTPPRLPVMVTGAGNGYRQPPVLITGARGTGYRTPGTHYRPTTQRTSQLNNS